MKNFLRVLVIFFVVGIASFTALVGYAYWEFTRPGAIPSEKFILVESGQGFRGITKQLQQEGVIRQRWVFEAFHLLTGQHRDFKAGEYRIAPAMSMRAISDMMVKGEVVRRAVTIPEGWTVKQAIALLNEAEALEGTITSLPEEGSLLPETYQYTRGDTRAALLARMQEAMRKKIEAAWSSQATASILQTPEDMVTLASIVERETGVADERAQIAAVYLNRLRIGMKLQADPTVIYGIERERGMALGRPLLYKDLESNSLYNTYRYVGLPPTPICNPGVASLEAVVHPADTDAIYFVATGEGDGRHYFASNLNDHNRNVARYRAAQRRNLSP